MNEKPQGASRLQPTVANLEFLSCDLQCADEFEILFDELLSRCRARGDMDTLRQAREILKRQCAFMLQQYKQRGGRFQFQYLEGEAEPEPKAEGTAIQ